MRFKNYKFVCNFNTLAEFEEITGVSMTKLGENMSIKHLRILAFEGFREGARTEHQDFEITKEDVGGWLSVKNMNLLVSEVEKAFSEKKEKPTIKAK